MAEYYDIAIIGSGSVAWHLGSELENAGHRVVEIYSRNPANARKFQSRLYQATIHDSLDFSQSSADVILICVSDDAIEGVAREIILPPMAVVAHTSGSQPMSKLGYTASENIGVCYPLQTFSKSKKVDFEGIPILVEAENDLTLKILKRLAASISNKVYVIKSADRMAIHLAAVFACNFSNFMFSVAEEILTSKGFDLSLLQPLIAETINKSLSIGPHAAQTGPAVRGDLETLDKHMAFLKESDYREIYRIISQSLLNRSE